MGKTHLLGNTISKEWNFMHENILKIIGFVMLEQALQKAEMHKLMPEISKITFNGGKIPFLTRHFRWRWRRAVRVISNFFLKPKLLTVIEQYKDWQPKATFALLETLDSKETAVFEASRRYLMYVGGPTWQESLKEFKNTYVPYDGANGEGLPKSQVKIGHFVSLFKGVSVLHLGAEPGYMIPAIAHVDCARLDVALFLNHFVPVWDDLRGWTWKGQEPDILKIHKCNLVPDKPVYFHKVVSPFDLEELYAGHEYVFSDIACCNGMCCNITGKALCPNPLLWLNYWVHFVCDSKIKVICKVNTSQLEQWWNVLEQKGSFTYKIFDKHVSTNPMSYERYVLLTPTLLPRMFKNYKLHAFKDLFSQQNRLWGSFATYFEDTIEEEAPSTEGVEIEDLVEETAPTVSSIPMIEPAPKIDGIRSGEPLVKRESLVEVDRCAFCGVNLHCGAFCSNCGSERCTLFVPEVPLVPDEEGADPRPASLLDMRPIIEFSVKAPEVMRLNIPSEFAPSAPPGTNSELAGLVQFEAPTEFVAPVSESPQSPDESAPVAAPDEKDDKIMRRAKRMVNLFSNLLGAAKLDVLDVGCGDGRMTQALYEITSRLGCLNSFDACDIVDVRFSSVTDWHFKLADDVLCGKKLYDVIVFSQSAHHIEHRDELDQYLRKVKIGGFVVFREHDYDPKIEHIIEAAHVRYKDDSLRFCASFEEWNLYMLKRAFTSIARIADEPKKQRVELWLYQAKVSHAQQSLVNLNVARKEADLKATPLECMKLEEKDGALKIVRVDPPVANYGIKADPDAVKRFGGTNLAKLMAHWLPCDIDGSQGLCVFKSIAAVKLGRAECYKELEVHFPGILCRHKPGDGVTHEAFVHILTKAGIPFYDDLGKTANIPDSKVAKKSLGAIIITMVNGVMHADVMMQLKGDSKGHLCSYVPYLRKAPVFLVKSMKYLQVDISSFSTFHGQDINTRVSEYVMRNLEAVSEAMYAAHQVAADSCLNSSCVALPDRNPLAFFMTGVPGACKTEVALSLIKDQLDSDRPHSVLAICSSNPAKNELIERFQRKFTNSREPLKNSYKLGFYSKTYAMAIAPKNLRDGKDKKKARSSEQYPIPNPLLKLVIVDECYTYPIYYIQYLAKIFPNAKFAFIGDPKQMTQEIGDDVTSAIEAERMQMTIFADTLGIHKRPQYDGHFHSNVSRRFGPFVCHMVTALAKRMHEKLEIYCDNMKEFKLEKRHKGDINELASSCWTMVASEKNFFKLSTVRTVHNIRKSQGLSQPTTAAVFDSTTCSMMTRYFSSAYVMLTRAQHKFIAQIFDQAEWINHKVDQIVDEKSYTVLVTKYVGGHYICPKLPDYVDPDFVEELMIRKPHSQYPTEVNHLKIEKYPPVPHLPFNMAELSWMGELEYGNTKLRYEAKLDNPGPIAVNLEKMKGKTTEVKLLSETSFGNQQSSSSNFQQVATMAHRMHVASVCRGKVKKHGYPASRIQQMMFDSGVLDRTKYEEYMTMPWINHFEVEAINEFKAVLKLPEHDYLMTTRDFMYKATYTVKNQIKAKSMESVVAQKPGQPLIAGSKAVNLIFSPMFRVMKKLMLKCLNPKIIWYSGMTPQQLAELWGHELFPFIDMTDYTEFDASQTEETNEGQFLFWLLFNPYGYMLDEYFMYVNGLFVISEVLSFWVLGQRLSGFPDTFDGNTLKQLNDLVISGCKGPYGVRFMSVIAKIVIGGDDRGIGSYVQADTIFETSWLEEILYANLKRCTVTHGVLEFSNWIIALGIAVYNPLCAFKKIRNKDYTLALSSIEKWEEYMDSWSVMNQGFRKDFFPAVRTAATFLNESETFVEYMFRTLDSFACLSYSTAKRVLKTIDVTMEDFHCGGVFANIQNKNNHQLKQSSMSTAAHYGGTGNPINEVLEIVAVDPKVSNPSVDYVASGPDHMRTFSCRVVGNCYGKPLVATGHGRTKADAKRVAFDFYLDRIKAAMKETMSNLIGSPRRSGQEEVTAENNRVSVQQFLKEYDRSTSTNGSVLPKTLEMLADGGENVTAQQYFNTMTIQRASDIPWLCCECQHKNGMGRDSAIKDFKLWAMCKKCGSNVMDHFATGLFWRVADDYDTYKWIPKFGSPAVEVKLVNQKGPRTNKGKRPKKAAPQLTKKAMKKKLKASTSHRSRFQAHYKAKKINSSKRLSKRKLTNAERIAASISLPGSVAPVRIEGGFDDLETAVAEPYTIESLNMNTVNDTRIAADDLAPSESMVFLTHNPGKAMILRDVKVGAGSTDCRYEVFGTSFDTSIDPDSLPEVAPVFTFRVNDDTKVPAPLCYSKPHVDSVWNPHGPLLFCFRLGSNPDYRLIPLTKGMKLRLTVTNISGSVTAGSVEAIIDKLNGEKLKPVGSWTVPFNVAEGTQYFYSVLETGYYTLGYKPNEFDGPWSARFAVDFFNEGANSIWGHRCIEGLVNNIGVCGLPRILSAGLTITNTTALLNREGFIRGVQVNGDKHWFEYVTDFDKAFRGKNCQTGKGGVNGFYGWLHPPGANYLEWKDTFRTNLNGDLLDTFAPVESEDAFTMIGIRMPDTAARSFEFTWITGIEYQTNDTWRVTEKPRYTERDFEAAVRILRKVPNFSENPTHIAEFWASIVNGAKTFLTKAGEVGAKIAHVAEMSAPLLAALA